MAHTDLSLTCPEWQENLEERKRRRWWRRRRRTRRGESGWDSNRRTGRRELTEEQWRKVGKKEGRWKNGKIKCSEEYWVGRWEMSGKRAQHERPFKMVGSDANVHRGEKELLCIEMTLICWKDLAMEGPKAHLIYSCPDPTIPHCTHTLWNRTWGPTSRRGVGLM